MYRGWAWHDTDGKWSDDVMVLSITGVYLEIATSNTTRMAKSLHQTPGSQSYKRSSQLAGVIPKVFIFIFSTPSVPPSSRMSLPNHKQYPNSNLPVLVFI